MRSKDYMGYIKAWAWQFKTYFQFYTTAFGGKRWLVSQELIKNVNTTLLACFPRKRPPGPVKPVPGYITLQPAELLGDRTVGCTSTSPATRTRLVSTTVGQSPQKARNPGKTYRMAQKFLVL